MKKLFYTLLFAACMSYASTAQNIDNVPDAVSTAFNTKFPKAGDVHWEMENNSDFEAEFELNDIEMSAVFDANGNWKETEQEIKTSELPEAVHATIKSAYAGFKVNEADKVESAEHGNCFEVELEKKEQTIDVLISGKGKVLKKTVVEDDNDDEEED